jgi:hypothetical protein
MPLTDFQRRVAHLIAGNRKPESHIAGGAVINRGDAGLRISEDLDIFHDLLTISIGQNATDLATAYADADERLLRDAGYSVEWQLRAQGFCRAVVSQGNDHVRLDWTSDSPYRFFPAQKDDDFGYCLHPADLAVNKVLALAGRSEIRDFLDILHLDHIYLSLGAITWAACGKDEGYTPSLIIDMANRHAGYQDSDLRTQNLVRPVELKALKRHWIEARGNALDLFDQLPADELGCLYLDQNNKVITPDPVSSDFPKLLRHKVSVRGAWPTPT